MQDDPWNDADTAHAASNQQYQRRAAFVYRGTKNERPSGICRAKGGYCHSECMLNEGHLGDHYGSGHDEGGPKPAIRWPQK